MTAAAILTALMRAGIEVRLREGKHLAVPAGRLTDKQRALVLEHREELIQFLLEVQQTSNALIEAAMLACDHHRDNDKARGQMRQDIESTPPHLRPDLLDHFNQTYGKAP